MSAEMHSAMMQLSTSYRLSRSGVVIDGVVPLDFGRYPYIPDIIDEERARRITILKGAQMGFTMACIMRVLEMAKHERLRGIGYYFPAEGEVSDFAKARFGPMMHNNNALWGQHVKDTDSSTLKQINDTFLYFRGMGQKGVGAGQRSMSKQKSIPLDAMVLDERDEMDDDRVESNDHRLDGAENPLTIILSTPTLPGYGVDYEYGLSDQRVWMTQCEHCNEWQCLDLNYPDCIAEPVNQDPYYICVAPRCRKPLGRTRGQWVIRETAITDHAGFWISQLSSPTSNALKIILAAQRAADKGKNKEFHNQNLARAFAEVDDEITASMLSELLTTEQKPLRDAGPCAMGVDPGKPHWYTVRKRLTDKDSLCIARGRADTYDDLDLVVKKFNVKSGVMDRGYDPSAVMDFVHKHEGWYGALYVGGRKSPPAWDHTKREVSLGRTYTLDSAHREIINKRVHHVRRDDFWDKEFVPQMTNLKRASTKPDPLTGDMEAVWVVTGGQKNDHLRHADAYCSLATERVGLSSEVVSLRNRSQEQDRGSKPRSPWTQ